MNSHTARHSVSVAGTITDDHGRVLLIQRADNHCWEPPGGVLELAETITGGRAAKSARKPGWTSSQSRSRASTGT